MKRVGIGVLAAAACALATAPADAAAATYSSCGGTWSGDGRSCSFIYYGGPITAQMGIRSAKAGGAMVKLEAPGSPVRELLAHCEVLGNWGACGMSSYSESDFVRRGTRLYCTVTGKLVTGGTYRCSSGG